MAYEFAADAGLEIPVGGVVWHPAGGRRQPAFDQDAGHFEMQLQAVGRPSQADALTPAGRAVTVALPVPLAAGGALQTAALPESLPTALSCVSLLGMVGTGIALLIFIRLLQSRGPLFASMVTYIVPAVALLLGSLDGEQVTPLQIGALCGVLAMVAIVQWPAPRPAVSEP